MNALPDTMPPQDIDSEMALIGSLLIDGSCFDDVLPIVPAAEAFYRADHRIIFGCVVAMHRLGIPLDVLTIKDHLDRGGNLDKIGGLEYVAQLMEAVPSAANAEYYARIVRDQHRRRLAMQAVWRAYPNLGNGQDLAETTAGIVSGIQGALDYGEAAELTPIDEVARQATAGREWGILLESGIIGLDTYGPFEGDLVILGARPSTGKTSLAL